MTHYLTFSPFHLFTFSLFMKEHQISRTDAGENLLNCAAYLGESIKSADGHAEAMKEIVPRFLAKENVDLAAALADIVEDPFSRDLLLTQVAEKCAWIDDDEYAFQLIEAMEDYGNQLRAREKVALAKAAKGDLEKAFEIAEELEHPDEVFAEVAVREAVRGDETDALETLEEIEFPYTKVSALQNIAAFHLKNDEKAKAVNFLLKAKAEAENIEFIEEQIRAFVEIGNGFLAAKENGKAIETFDKAKTITEDLDNVHRDSFFGDISLGFLYAGSLDLADRTLDLVADKTQMVTALLGFSQYFHAKGEETDAFEALEEAYAILKSQKDLEIRDSRMRYRLWTACAIIFARYGKEERAIEIASEIPEEQTQMSALRQTAEVFAAQGKDDFSAQAVKAIADEGYKMLAFISMADAKNEAGTKEEAVKYLNEAYFHAGLVDRFALRSEGYKDLAKRFFEAGEAEKAREICTENLEIITRIKDDSVRAAALANLSDLYDEAGFDLTDAEREILQTIVRKAES
jgi:tetratricopeptide (TPR) repeat protein